MNILSCLREKNISQDWIDKTDLRVILDKAYIIKQTNLINSATEWFAKELMEIDSNSKKADNGEEREGAAIIYTRWDLEKEKFGDKLDNIIKKVKDDNDRNNK